MTIERVEKSGPPDIDLPPPWRDVREPNTPAAWRSAISDEVAVEVGPPPQGTWEPVAACGACDDVVFATTCGRFLYWHVTWSRSFEEEATLLSWDEAAASIRNHEPAWE